MNVFEKIFQELRKILTIQTIVLSSSRGQANFRGLEASRPRPRTSICVLEDVLEPRTSSSQGRPRVLHLCLTPHPNLQTTRESNFCTCHLQSRTLFSNYSDLNLTIRSPERGFLISVTLALYLARPHCANITKHGQRIPYDKFRNCPCVWCEGSGGLPG